MSKYKKHAKLYFVLSGVVAILTVIGFIFVALGDLQDKAAQERSAVLQKGIQEAEQRQRKIALEDDFFEQEEREKAAHIEEREADAKLKEMEPTEVKRGWVVESSKTLYPVLFIYDGDTIAISMKGKTEKIRLIGIDSPETSEKYRSVECHGKEATNRATELLKNKKVRIEMDETQDNEDVYGRSLRYIFLEDGTFFNQLMIEEGFAKEYTFKGKEYKYQKEFRAAEKKAREEKKGLWGECETKE